MKHKKCGGKFVRVEQNEREIIYQCNKCSTVRTMYKRITPKACVGTATSGNPVKPKKERRIK